MPMSWIVVMLILQKHMDLQIWSSHIGNFNLEMLEKQQESSSSDEMMSDFENSFFLKILNNLKLWHYFQNPHRDEILL